MCETRVDCPLCHRLLAEGDEVKCSTVTLIAGGRNMTREYLCKCGGTVRVDAKESLVAP